MRDQHVIDAVVILNKAWLQMERSPYASLPEGVMAALILDHAIRHISRPERDVYPKTRRGTKAKPVYGRNRSPWTGYRGDLK